MATESYQPLPEEPETPRKLYREKIGLRDYVIIDEEREVIERWAAQIQELRDAIERRDIEYLEKNAPSKHFRPHAGKIYETLGKEGLDEEDKTLLAIGLWIQREQDQWRMWKTVMKVLKGGTYSLASFLKENGKTSCLDSSVLSKKMANFFQIEGTIERAQPKNKYSHRYFQSNSGKVVDVWWGYRRGGLFQKKEEFEKKKKIAKHLCGKAS